MFELKWQNTFTNFSSAVETHCYSFPGSSEVREIECCRLLSEGDRKLPNLKESTLGKIACKERGIFVHFVFCIFEEVNFICTAKCSILNEKNGCSSMI